MKLQIKVNLLTLHSATCIKLQEEACGHHRNLTNQLPGMIVGDFVALVVVLWNLYAEQGTCRSDNIFNLVSHNLFFFLSNLFFMVIFAGATHNFTVVYLSLLFSVLSVFITLTTETNFQRCVLLYKFI